MPTSLKLVSFFLYLLLIQLMLLKRIMIPKNVLTSVLGSGDGREGGRRRMCGTFKYHHLTMVILAKMTLIWCPPIKDDFYTRLSSTRLLINYNCDAPSNLNQRSSTDT